MRRARCGNLESVERFFEGRVTAQQESDSDRVGVNRMEDRAMVLPAHGIEANARNVESPSACRSKSADATPRLPFEEEYCQRKSLPQWSRLRDAFRRRIGADLESAFPFRSTPRDARQLRALHAALTRTLHPWPRRARRRVKSEGEKLVGRPVHWPRSSASSAPNPPPDLVCSSSLCSGGSFRPVPFSSVAIAANYVAINSYSQTHLHSRDRSP